MRNSILAAGAVLAASISTVKAQSAVEYITFTDMTNSGSYNAVTSLVNGQCSTASQGYSGAFSPLNEEVTVIFRGPVNLKEFAVYHGAASSKREVASAHHRRNAHGHLHHKRDAQFEKRDTYTRTSYYNSGSAESDGLVFLGNPPYSSQLSFLNSDGTSTGSTQQVLADVTVPSDVSYQIWSDTVCNNDCAYTPDGSLAYHGFDTSKNVMFFFEFGMPTDNSGTENVNLPAIWFLNSRIPRVEEYGTCTCWTQDGASNFGCGEFDLFEANPTNGPDMLLPMFHCMGNKSGGSSNSDYFARPYTGTMRAVVAFCYATQTIQMARLADLDIPDLSNVDPSKFDQICNLTGGSVASFSTM